MHKHILFVLDYYLPHKGGSETVFEAVISRLLQKGYTITLLTSRFDKNLPQEEKKTSFCIYRGGKNRIKFMRWAFRKGVKLLSKKSEIGFIHTCTYGGALPASLLGIFFQKKVILTVHEIFGNLRKHYKGWWMGWWYKMFEKLIFLFPYDVYHCVSYYTMNSLRLIYNIPDQKLVMIHNGVDTNFWNPRQVSAYDKKRWKNKYGRNNRFVVTYYGHAGKSKGLDYLVRAIPELVAIDPKLLIVFNLIDSKRTTLIKNQIAGYKVGHAVQIFHGLEKEELRTLVASSDMIVAPSLSEGFGSVHTEAVAMKKPLLTTYVGSIPEVVSGNVKFVAPCSKREIIQSILQAEQWINNDKYILPPKKFSRNTTVEKLITLYH